MRISSLIIAVLSFGILTVYSCGRQTEVKTIGRLYEKYQMADKPQIKSELANALQKEFSLYQLKHENDTLFLKRWAAMAREGMEYKMAHDIYSIYLEKIKNDPEAYRNSGEVNATLGHFQEASGDFSTLARLLTNEDQKAKYMGYADLYNTIDSCIRLIENDMSEDSHVDVNRLKRAQLYIRVGQFAAARYDIEKVEMQNSHQAFISYLRALMEIESGELIRAEEAIDSYLSLSSASDSLYSKGVKLKSDIELKLRKSKLEASLAAEPFSYKMLMEAGTLSFSLQDYSGSIKYFSSLIEVYPDSLLGFLYRSQAFIQSGLPEQALRDINKALMLNKDNVSAHNLKAYIHLLQKDYVELEKEIQIIEQSQGTLLDILKTYKAEK